MSSDYGTASVHIRRYRDHGAASVFITPYAGDDPEGGLELDLLVTNTSTKSAIFVLEVALKALKEVEAEEEK